MPNAFGTIEDVILSAYHSAEKILARSPRTMTVESDDSELRFDAEIANTVDGDAALELVKRGDLSGASIEFMCKRDRDVAGVREIVDATLYGISLVSRPAYQSSLQARERSLSRRKLWVPL